MTSPMHSPLQSPLQPVMRSPLEFRRRGGGYVFPLDVAGLPPEYAYATVKLSSTYTGPSVRVVRPSDSAEQDIGFAGNVLDKASLSTFLGAEIGRVNVFYDQSGNGRDGVQTTAGDRPYISPNVVINGIVSPAFIESTIRFPDTVVLSRQSITYFDVTEGYNGELGSHVGHGADIMLFAQGRGFQGFGFAGLSPWYRKNSVAINHLTLNSSADVFLHDAESLATSAQVAGTETGGGIGYFSGGGYKGQYYGSSFMSFNRVVYAAEADAIKGALASIFSAGAAVTRRVIFDGDSICASGAPFDSLLYGFAKQSQRMLPSSVAAYNFAGGGNTLSGALIPNYASGPGALFTYYGGSEIMFVHVGTNDITILGRTDAQIYADLQTYCGLVRASGSKVVVSTVLPAQTFSFDATKLGYQLALNASIRANWASFADGFADFALDPTMGPQSATFDTSLYPDGLHPSILGHSYLAPIAAAAISALL